jgi:hypothetical protein
MGRPNPFPTFAEAMMEELDELAWMTSFVDSLFSGMLNIRELASLHQRLWMASRILVLTDKTRIHLRSASVQTYTFFTTGIP